MGGASSLARLATVGEGRAGSGPQRKLAGMDTDTGLGRLPVGTAAGGAGDGRRQRSTASAARGRHVTVI